MKFLAFVVLLHGLISAQCANILGVFHVAGKSHFLMFERLLIELANKGHNVDVATHFPIKNPPPRYNQLSLVGSVPIMVNNVSIQAFESLTNSEMIQFITHFLGTHACEATLNSPALQNLKKTTKKYDLVISEIFGADCMLGFGHYFNAPTVSIISSTLLPWSSNRFGIPDNPSYIPTYFTIATAEMSLYERVQNTITLLSSKFWYYYYNKHEDDRIARNYFGESLPSLSELAYNTSLLLVNSHFSLNYARPMVPNVVEVGGLHIQKPKPLPEKFEKLLTIDVQNGVIYLTMGSLIVTETIEPDKLQGMFDAFADLPYKVLWKASREKFPQNLRFPENIHFEPWMPQLDILCHPNVKLFVSHGGLMGTQEAIYCGVPRLGIPLFADQDANIMNSEKMGTTIKVDYHEISKETIYSAAKRLLENPSYQQNTKQLSDLFKDRPVSALDTAIFWIEYVIRYKGAPHLRSAGANLTWYQYYLLDVAVILITPVFIMLYLLLKLCRNDSSEDKFRVSKNKFD